jgi:hypothetical protein
MVEHESKEKFVHEFEALEKHSYPQWIKIFWCGVFIVFLFSMGRFVWKELPCHCKLSAEIALAERYFQDKNYVQASKMYGAIFLSYPQYKCARIRMAEMAFVFCSQNFKFFADGLDILSNAKLSRGEFDEITTFVPQEYQEDFKSCFKSVKE